MEAALRVMSRVGPADFSLNAVAREAGVTAAALIQRFGSKRALQLALARASAEGSGEMIHSLRGSQPSALATIRAYGGCMAGLAATPQALARNLSYLAGDIADPELRRHLLAQSRATRQALAALVVEAMDEGDLARDTDAEALARLLETVIGGALFTWAVYREGKAAEWVVAQVDAVLASHRVTTRRRKR